MKWMRRREQDPPSTCRCSPQWPALEAELNGYVDSVLPDEHGSPIGGCGLFPARCAVCKAVYPGNWVGMRGTPPPFPWAREEAE
ncbi:hypothetical protein Mame01_07230 [Microbispora amethystogenes]|nr:hypothetical protein Mame01_07230 [Microbispora amethystogenes]